MIPAALLACALNVHPITLNKIVSVESGGNPLALNVNRLAGAQPRPASVAEAVRLAESYIARGHSVDLGLAQINSRNLPRLGLTIEQVLDPCTNIAASGRILTANYADAARRWGEGQTALRAALSAYNTGSFSAGFRNGYVAKYYGPGAVPALTGKVRQAAAGIGSAGKRAALPNPYTADIAINFEETTHVQFVQ